MDELLRLDGNALAGTLQQIFAVDVTAASGCCAKCGRVAEFGAQHLYRHPLAPGAVLRCAACGNVLLVLVERRNDFRLTLRGLSWIELKT